MMKLPKKESERQRRAVAEMGPQAIATFLRQAIQLAWMSSPEPKRTVADVGLVIREILDGLLRDMAEDLNRFDHPSVPPPGGNLGRKE
jgi:hypothetical protein